MSTPDKSGALRWPLYAPRPFATPPPDSLIDDCPNVLVRINKAWLPHLIGVINALDQPDVWTGSLDEIEDARSEVRRLFSVLEEGTMLLRQSQTNSCILEGSSDCGQTWQPVFDYSQCLPPTRSDGDTFIDAQTTINNNMAIYEGDITNIWPDWGYDGGASDSIRDDVLCYAIAQWVGFLCESAIEIIKDQDSELKDRYDLAGDLTTAFAGISGALAAFSIFVPGAVIAAVAFACASVLLEHLESVVSTDISAWQDQDARDVVACDLYSAMVGQTPTFAAWGAALDSYTSEYSDNAGMIGWFVDVQNQSEDSFVSWLGIMADLIGVVESTGAELPCDVCGCGDWEETFDFSQSNQGFSAYWISSEGNPLGEYRDAAWRETIVLLADGFQGSKPSIAFDARQINRVQVHYDASDGVFTKGQIYAMRAELLLNGEYVHYADATAFGDDKHVIFEIPEGVVADLLVLDSRVSTTDAPGDAGGGSVAIHSCAICGDGVNPFEV